LRYPSFLVVLALSLAATPARSESLGRAARRERERRQKNEEAGVKPVRTITNDDVRTKSDEPGSKSATPANGKDAESADRGSHSLLPAEERATEARRSSEESTWRSRAQAARGRLEIARERLKNTPPQIGYFSGTRYWSTSNPAYADAQLEVKAAERAIQDLEEQARRAGALPGWLR
jgi:hypothetical protein